MTTEELPVNLFFPNGRPIFDLVSKSEKLFFVGGFGNPIMQCVFVEKVKDKNDETVGKAIEQFIERDADKI